jgi:hypothetical protein
MTCRVLVMVVRGGASQPTAVAADHARRPDDVAAVILRVALGIGTSAQTRRSSPWAPTPSGVFQPRGSVSEGGRSQPLTGGRRGKAAGSRGSSP